MKKILGILRGFPGLGRIVSGVTVLETLRDNYGFDVKIISYLQGSNYLKSRGYVDTLSVCDLDYCAIGLLPTSKAGAHIHKIVKEFNPDIFLIDGEPLMLQSLRLSYPNIKIVTLLNPADIDNPSNDKEAMDFFNQIYMQSDLAIVHGLRHAEAKYAYSRLVSIPTILRNEITAIENISDGHSIYCLLGGGTVNVGMSFSDSTIQIAKICISVAKMLPQYSMNIICSSDNIYDSLKGIDIPKNVLLYREIIDATIYYSNATLVITRSGRNSLSELVYLGIPTISFVSGCSFRKSEQIQNIRNLNASNIHYAETSSTTESIALMCKKAIEQGRSKNKQFTSGLENAVKLISGL